MIATPLTLRFLPMVRMGMEWNRQGLMTLATEVRPRHLCAALAGSRSLHCICVIMYGRGLYSVAQMAW